MSILRRKRIAFTTCLLFGVLSSIAGARAEAPVFNLADRVELFVDHRLIDRLENGSLRLHPPEMEEVAIRFESPWDGPYAAYVTVFQDDDRFRMYYRGWPNLDGDQMTCYAESQDGRSWTKPSLGLVAFEDSTENNIILRMPGTEGTHNFAPFRDRRPGIPDAESYKALGGQPPYAFTSQDGLRWRRASPSPVLTQGAFDSQNLAFWDPVRGVYVAYFRVMSDGFRSIAMSTSEDFLNWSEPEPLELDDAPREHLYTNAAIPYFRSPAYLFLFPMRFVPDRRRLGSHPEPGISDAVLFSSRDGIRFDRTFHEALLRPGRDSRNWGDRSNMPAWGLIQTGPDEMSMYFSQHYRQASHHLRRGVYRLDGLASFHADSEGADAELITRPFQFTGRWLVLNYATSAAGGIRVEIQDTEGAPIPGFTLDEAPPAYGDEIAEAYSWNDGPDVSSLAGRPIRLRFVARDADLFSYRFAE